VTAAFATAAVLRVRKAWCLPQPAVERVSEEEQRPMARSLDLNNEGRGCISGGFTTRMVSAGWGSTDRRCPVDRQSVQPDRGAGRWKAGWWMRLLCVQAESPDDRFHAGAGAAAPRRGSAARTVEQAHPLPTLRCWKQLRKRNFARLLGDRLGLPDPGPRAVQTPSPPEALYVLGIALCDNVSARRWVRKDLSGESASSLARPPLVHYEFMRTSASFPP